MPDSEHIPISQELLQTMRGAAKIAIDLREPFITPRAILLALLEDPSVGTALGDVVSREKVLSAKVEQNFGNIRVIDDRIPGETAAMTRYDTLAFKTPDGVASMWLSREAYNIFLEGAQRAEERYSPKQLALGLAAEAVLAPGILAAIRVEPGRLIDAIYRL
jgi:hypothetical protein